MSHLADRLLERMDLQNEWVYGTLSNGLANLLIKVSYMPSLTLRSVSNKQNFRIFIAFRPGKGTHTFVLPWLMSYFKQQERARYGNEDS
jgi:hypothetical protein